MNTITPCGPHCVGTVCCGPRWSHHSDCPCRGEVDHDDCGPPMLTPDDIGGAIMELARAKGWSRNQLADYAEVSRAVLSQWYGSQSSYPSVRLLLRVAMALGIPASELLRLAEERQAS